MSFICSALTAKEVISIAKNAVEYNVRRYSYVPLQTMEVEDITSEVVKKVYTKGHLYDPGKKASPATWISVIARNTVIDALEDRRQYYSRVVELEHNKMGSRALIDPHRELDLKDYYAEVMDYISQMDDTTIQVIHLLGKGTPNKEIAQQCGLSESTTNTRICRIRKILRAQFPHIAESYSECAGIRA